MLTSIGSTVCSPNNVKTVVVVFSVKHVRTNMGFAVYSLNIANNNIGFTACSPNNVKTTEA